MSETGTTAELKKETAELKQQLGEINSKLDSLLLRSARGSPVVGDGAAPADAEPR